METVVRGEHSVVTGLKQTHIASVVGPLRSEETNDLLTVCYKLQNKDLMRGYELMLERVQEKRSVFHAGRDLEMRKQWEVARLCYERLFDAREQQKNEELLVAEANLNYYHCLQCSGNWKEVRHLHLQPSASFAQSLQVLNWKIESAWRGGDWTSCQQFVGEVEWARAQPLREGRGEEDERWLFGERRASRAGLRVRVLSGPIVAGNPAEGRGESGGGAGGDASGGGEEFGGARGGEFVRELRAVAGSAHASGRELGVSFEEERGAKCLGSVG